ncbi:hypothetical protein ACH82I_07555 [Brevibacterium sp. GP-SGM9]|uniref:hypothetical protein n=1 Tax=Brevibacterium sp. GP-SGM9 TaxID=3376990 RepID=UPI0039A54DE2
MKHFILVVAAAAATFLIAAAATVLTHKQIDPTLVLTWVFNTALIMGIVEYAWYSRARSAHDTDDLRMGGRTSPRADQQPPPFDEE